MTANRHSLQMLSYGRLDLVPAFPSRGGFTNVGSRVQFSTTTCARTPGNSGTEVGPYRKVFDVDIANL